MNFDTDAAIAFENKLPDVPFIHDDVRNIHLEDLTKLLIKKQAVAHVLWMCSLSNIFRLKKFLPETNDK